MNVLETNGGFPEPVEGDPVRVVRAAHDACGAETRIRIPGYLPPRAVRRVVCGECATSFECGRVEELAGSDPIDRAPVPDAGAPRGPDPTVATPAADPPVATSAPRFRLPFLPPASSRFWRWVGIPLAAAAVVAALLLLQGEDEPSPTVTVGASGTATAPEAPGADGAEGAGGGPPSEARFVTQPGFSLALPPGWEQTPSEGGASFTAAATDGTADATLWIERAPDLTFAEFETRSLEQLRSLTGNAEVIERIPAPTAAGTVVRLRADTPEGTGVSAPYDVTLRAAGPFRYYLATTVQPGASREASEGADLIHGSFIPEPEGGGAVETSATPGSEGSEAPSP